MMVKISSRTDCNAAHMLSLQQNAEKKLHPVVKIAKEESEDPVRHRLKVDDIYLTARVPKLWVMMGLMPARGFLQTSRWMQVGQVCVKSLVQLLPMLSI